MIGLIAIKRDVQINIREKLTIKESKKEDIINELLKKVEEVVIVSTCNRTEIYLNHSLDKDKVIKEIFKISDWDTELLSYIFYREGRDVYKHLFEVACGYHSKIMGEDQILGQVKEAHNYSAKLKGAGGELGRLFQEAVTCGKKFRKEANLFEIPVSAVSIAVNSLIKRECKKVMVIGYGEIGKLTIKYLLSHKIKDIYLVLRDSKKAEELNGVNILNFKEKSKYINDMDAVVSCTSAPHVVISRNNIDEKGKDIIIYDMAVPRDVDEDLINIDRVKVFNIDEISKIEDDNRSLRVQRMNSYRYIIEKYIKEYDEWIKLRKLSPTIRNLKDNGKKISEKRILTFEHKSKSQEDLALAKMLINSTSDSYVNRAIEVLKEEWLKDGGEECLRIIRKIFLEEK
ncbi:MULTISPECIES: glutamyl-tRNA reductase [Clostridium]|uniref:Glutamyl-tRNA reductase n=1 Tax=Clostridium cibarium TaxID=2762247 RepID=A0ABR8PU08_9CLOT|nr:MULTISPECIES: glutamyl-tRNA reductase [Clostridium]MBD7911658.1 glutamyl-tRNA reductase [Clostridium cibarium]